MSGSEDAASTQSTAVQLESPKNASSVNDKAPGLASEGPTFPDGGLRAWLVVAGAFCVSL